MQKSKRIDEIDIIKALAIVFMVANHSGAPYERFTSLFHMAVFFIASGFTYRNSNIENLENVFDYIKKRIKSLWLPYFVWNTIYTLLNNFFIKVNIYTNNADILNYKNDSNVIVHEFLNIKEMLVNILKGIFFYGDTTLGGAFWFLKILFFVSIIYCVIDYVVNKYLGSRKTIIQGIISILFLCVGYFLHLKNINIFGLDRILSYYILYYIGYVLSNFKYENIKDIYYILTIFVSFVVLTILMNIGTISLNSAEYENPAFFLISSISGWFFLYSISYFINRVKIRKIFIEIGKRTLSVLILHFLSMKIVQYIICIYYDLPLYYVGIHPNICAGIGLWWIAYTVVGVIIPVLLDILYSKIKTNLTNSLKTKKLSS